MSIFTYYVIGNLLQNERPNIDIIKTPSSSMLFIRSQRGAAMLVQNGYIYRCQQYSNPRSYWICINHDKTHSSEKCLSRLVYKSNELIRSSMHTHSPHWKRLQNQTFEYKNLNDDDIEMFLKGRLKSKRLYYN